jgi:formylglycine-generating enzyme required for sulfatase activity
MSHSNDSTLASGTAGPEGYRLLEVLGRGAFGEVWRAEAPGGIQVAVKILSLALKPDAARREFAALQSILELRHPYLLSLHAIFAQGDRILIVMELASGSLRDRLETCQQEGKPGIPPRELLGYVREAAEALDFLHAHQRLHRDIKPENILLLAQHAKVADYGLARVLGTLQTAQTTSVVGTPRYMAPETWEGSVGPRSDQYSLAASYVELRSGQRPFEGQNLPHLAHLHMNVAPDLGWISGAERQVLERALAKKSADRYPTCLPFVAELARAVQAGEEPAAPKKATPAPPTAREAGGQGATASDSNRATQPTPRVTPKRPGGRARWVVAACLALLLLAGVLGGGAWLHHKGATAEAPGGGPTATEQSVANLGPGATNDAGGHRPGGTGKGGDPGGKTRTPGEVAEVQIAPGVRMKFCWVPPGEAQLGSPKAERQKVLRQIEEDKEPEWLAAEAEEVRGRFSTKGFWLGKYPVTQEEWRALMKDNPSPSFFKPGQDKVEEDGITDTSRFPVDNVSWNDCQEFLKKLNADAVVPAAMGKGKVVLPHEDEWEYACRGGKGNGQPFYFGDRLNGDLANCDGNWPYGTDAKGVSKVRTTEVGGYEGVAPHPWGLCDMHGNLWQWCDNVYPKVKDYRVLRGGSWSYIAGRCRAAHRIRMAPDSRTNFIGCRACFRPD